MHELNAKYMQNINAQEKNFGMGNKSDIILY